MSNETRVIYNGGCPLCSREMAHYQRVARETGACLSFQDLRDGDLDRFGLTEDTAARRLHVVENGEIVDGVEAFACLWARLPRFRWLARLVRLPGVQGVAALSYDRVVAPAIYRRWRRRNPPG